MSRVLYIFFVRMPLAKRSLNNTVFLNMFGECWGAYGSLWGRTLPRFLAHFV